jgi:hypothetical protein
MEGANTRKKEANEDGDQVIIKKERKNRGRERERVREREREEHRKTRW